MNVRKLQGEIDKTLKKVQEGVAEFDAILKKVYAATSSNQKDKYEGDLKKEIKKLQRYRDQIKNWLTNNEVKNKSPLLENRKLVEQKMEQFKACEKETKTKAYSKEGLGHTPKDNDAKIQVRYWAGKAISSLKSQIESFETDIENIPVRKRKTESSKVESIQKYLEHHRYHLRALELLRRAMENDKIPAEEIEKIKDSVEYYIDNYEDENNEEPEEIYGGFNLKISTANTGDDDLDLSFDESDDDDDDDLGISSESDGENNDLGDEDSSNTATPSAPLTSSPTISALPTLATPTATASTTASANKPNNQSHPPNPSPSLSSTASNTNNPANKIERISSPPAVNINNSSNTSTTNAGAAASAMQQQNSRNSTPSPTFSSVTKSNIKGTTPETSSKQTAPIQQSQPQPQPLPQMTSPQSQPSPYPQPNVNLPGNLPMAQRLQMHQQQVTAAAQIQQQMVAQQQAAAAQQQQQQQQQQQFNMRNSRSNIQQYPYQLKDDIESAKDSLSQLNLLKSNSPPHGSSPSPPGIGGESADDIKNNETFDTSSNLYPGTLAELSSATMSRIQNETNGVGIGFAGPSGQSEPSATKMHSQNYEENLSITRAMMETSFKFVPEYKDYDRQLPYLPKNPKQTPSYYPHIPLPIFDQPAIFEKFEIDPLFFIFYFKQGTYQQFLAARELKKQGWRYHKKYLTWFRRHEEPKEITNDYEQGTYVYFDYETGWCQRKKTEFTFEYRFLEE